MKVSSIFIFIFVSEAIAQYGNPQQGYQQSYQQQQNSYQPQPLGVGPQQIQRNNQQTQTQDSNNATTVGGQGCVVTGRILFINGIKDHELSADEMEQLQEYNTALQKYKDQIKQIQQFRGQMQQYQGGQSQFNQPYPQQQFQQQQPNQFNQGYQQQQPYGYNNNFNYRQGRQANSQATTQPAANGAGSEQLVNPDHPVTSTLMPNLTMPSPPELPGFCSQNATAQYVFDSCMVQGNKVYIGGAYARDLTTDEQTQLDDYATKLAAYQNQTQSAQQQNFYGNQGFRVPPQQQQQNQQAKAPTEPNFCQTLLDS